MSDSEMMRDLSADDRPREKAWQQGTSALTESELLAILLRTGIKGKSVVAVSREIMRMYDNDPARLARTNPRELSRLVPGIGPTKAITVMAAIELGARCQSSLAAVGQYPKVDSSQAFYWLMRPRLERLPHEEFWVLALNRANRVETKWMLSQGGMASTVVDLRLLFKRVLDSQACAIALVHNHPSGQLVPSGQDDSLTRRVVEAGRLLDIKVIDHLIIGPTGFYSYHDNGRMPQ